MDNKKQQPELVEDMFGGVLKRAFPDATKIELYGASIIMSDNGDLELRCGGEVKHAKLRS